jgi:peptidoglycan-associated lipoprotein
MKAYALLASLVAVPAVALAQPARPAALSEVHFAFDSARLPADIEQHLESVVHFAADHPDTRLVLDAHCDPRGTSPYNVRLAIHRAESVRNKLAAMGVPRDQIVFAIYGKDGAPAASYAQDRRVELWATREPLAQVIDRTFAGNGTSVTWTKPLTTAQIDAAPQPVATR